MSGDAFTDEGPPLHPQITRRVLVVSGDPDRAPLIRQLLSEGVGRQKVAAGAGDGLGIVADAYAVDAAGTAFEASNLVQVAAAVAHPYAVAVIDADVPDGCVAGLHLLWEHDPSLEMLVVAGARTAWPDGLDALERLGQVLLVPRPLDHRVLRHLLAGVTEKWVLRQVANAGMAELEVRVAERTSELADANTRLRDEMDQRAAVEAELRHAQKLEAMGRLAAGIAHEINTPMQYVGDNLHFVQTGLSAMQRVIRAYRESVNEATLRPLTAADIEHLLKEESAADLAYVTQHIDGAIASVFEGVERVTTIVRSMKDLSHPGARDPIPTDLDRLVQSAIAIARTETKRVAQVVFEGGAVGVIPCHPGDLGQVVLNLLVNAAHAIEGSGTTELGVIRVRTRTAGGGDQRAAVIEVEDTGPGVPEEIRGKIFEPFFTTKAVGKGTGQGLALVRAIIVERHHGQIEVADAPGRGALFRISIPIGTAE